MTLLVQKYITGTTAVKIAASIEQAIRGGKLAAGQQLPTVRTLAKRLGVSPATVASAYRTLQGRAVLVAGGRRGTRVGHRPLAAPRRRPVPPRHAVILDDGNPDPALLPDFHRVLRDLDYQPRLYGQEPMHAGLMTVMRREMAAESVAINNASLICPVNGAMDGLDRLFAEHLRPGDRVAVEDPGFTGHHDLIASRGLTLVPIQIDEHGMLPDALERACREGVHAALITPRAQSPTGAALSETRARELRHALRSHKHVLVIEDDHISFLKQGEFHPVHQRDGKWAHLRSFSKAFNPDLRLAVMTGDEQTMTRVVDRMIIVERWVSLLLQAAAHALLSDRSARAQVAKAGAAYDARREALLEALRRRGFKPMGRSGYNIWLPVDEETAAVQALAQAEGGGWAVAAGERFRLASPPGIRITASRLSPRDAERFAADAAASTVLGAVRGRQTAIA